MKKVYKFSATWCPPCKRLSENLRNIESPIQIEEIDIDLDENKELSRKFKIRGIPTMVIVDGDVELKRKSGPMSAKEYLEWVNE
jgi:thioredoxin 1